MLYFSNIQEPLQLISSKENISKLEKAKNGKTKMLVFS